MGIFDKEAPPDHPLYRGGSLIGFNTTATQGDGSGQKSSRKSTESPTGSTTGASAPGDEETDTGEQTDSGDET